MCVCVCVCVCGVCVCVFDTSYILFRYCAQSAINEFSIV